MPGATGRGHNAAFAAFLHDHCKMGTVGVEDQLVIIFRLYDRCLEFMWKLQKTYNMEPAGSQGAWELDYFQFLPFI
ncbi:hypothetical protein AAFF_G00130260 [Aldrovandia affinis]|uniref:Serine/threonine-protein phosphatase 2A activator n=1 Tax=Aldrovandia affinis TaxID=143900 RepID=A0AAD7RQZ5_9TELE|nr:hypothetical protein AAFF_G00130260 [Aldrovandia affinis]